MEHEIEKHKPALSHTELRDIVDLSLWAGQLLLQYGAESQRVEETIHQLATSLGCDWVDILVSPNVIIITTTSGQEFRTKVRRVVDFRVDFSVVSAVNDLKYRVTNDEMDRISLRKELERISRAERHYNRWVVIGMVGLACAAFSRLFEGDWPIFVMTFLSSATAMFVRQELVHRYFNNFLVVIATSFVAGCVASLGILTVLGKEASQTVLAASVLLLVPGVPLINGVQDLIKGHTVIGIVRGLVGGLVSLAIALGLLMAMGIFRIEGL